MTEELELHEFKREINLNTLRSQHLLIATPLYGDVCYGEYHRSMINLTNFFTSYGLPMTSYYVLNDSLITRARNNCVQKLMNTPECTHLMFIDADIGFKELDVVSMWDMCVNKDYPILAGVYPK